ncbi:hypothetical protein BXY70_3253 [Roseovarius halotolerans]|uniref:Uncharacterized protein n=1 Tax=Roseovarius halotolerans TaxID=505353 RepID=A0A1X6ZSB1_9RHOB|nr:hypothetical protein [Roseovarius halotolerans]RKT27898.1 hypothetical protein BXY70_3253 [Roseovarius halotolerans]SLN59820.1 hypothetical protein ROH8110_03347 [Roseovarius halotolerans]
MSPPDTEPQRDKRRHRGPLIMMALVVAFGVGIILYWIVEEASMAPGPEGGEEERPAADITEGDVNAPDAAQTETVAPSDGEVEIEAE